MPRGGGAWSAAEGGSGSFGRGVVRADCAAVAVGGAGGIDARGGFGVGVYGVAGKPGGASAVKGGR